MHRPTTADTTPLPPDPATRHPQEATQTWTTRQIGCSVTSTTITSPPPHQQPVSETTHTPPTNTLQSPAHELHLTRIATLTNNIPTTQPSFDAFMNDNLPELIYSSDDKPSTPWTLIAPAPPEKLRQPHNKHTNYHRRHT